MNLSFLYKNYEKIALTIVLVIFFIALLWLIDLFNKSEEARAIGVTILVSKIKYDQLPPSYFNFEESLQNSPLWQPSTKRNLNKNDEFYIAIFTDFMKPFKIIRSPAFKAEGKLIPYEYCKIGYCPITKEKISLPDISILEKSTDTDADGVPDITEKQLGMNPANASDANQDMDKDSFTNLQEYEEGGESLINNPSKHPPLIKRIVLLNIAKAKIPFILKKIIKKGENKKDWIIQVNVTDAQSGPKTLFLNLGSTIDLNDREYKITDIIDKYYEKLDPSLGTIIKYDDSTVVFKSSKGEDIQATVNKSVYEQDKVATVEDLYTGETYKLRLKNTITIGNSITGLETYELSKIEDKGKSDEESLSFINNGKTYTVKKTTDYVNPLTVDSTKTKKETSLQL